MQAVLMAGGEGRRLRPITAVLPKPLVPIGDLAILEIVLRQLKWYGFEKVVLCVGYRAELIMAVVGGGKRYGLEVTYNHEKEPLGTLGALTAVDALEDDFLVLNGDVCTDLDFGALLRRHVEERSLATVSAYARREKVELGVLELDDRRENLVGFKEKPSYDFWVAMGVNAFNRQILELIPEGRSFGFDDLMGSMLERRRPVRVVPHDGFWLDIGRPDDYERIQDEFPRRRAALLPDEAADG